MTGRLPPLPPPLPGYRQSMYSPSLAGAETHQRLRPTSYGQPVVCEHQTWQRPVHSAMHLPPMRGQHEMTRQPQPPHSRGPFKTVKIDDLLSPVEDIHFQQVHSPQPIVPRHSLYPTTSTTFPVGHVRRVQQPTQQQWDDFATRFEATQPKVQPGASTRPQSCDRASDRASLSSGSSATSSPSASFSEVSSQLSPEIPALSPSIKVAAPPTYDYNLSFRQQPVAARACGHGDRDRRVIDPPPIVELKITHQLGGAPAQDSGAIFALHCSLLDPETDKEAATEDSDCRTPNIMMGASAASPFQGKDEHGCAGTFFIFSDLSCRYQGRYRLQFELLRIDCNNMTPGAKHGMVAIIKTDVFTSFTAKDFPGMQASTPLLKALRRQGLTVGIKKGSEARKLKGKLRRSLSNDDSESARSVTDLKGKRIARASREGSPSSVKLNAKIRQANKRARCEAD